VNRKSEIGIGHLSAGQKRTAAATHNLVGLFSKWKVNTMTNISNKLAPAQVVAKLNGLATDRATWEMARSNKVTMNSMRCLIVASH
jgi:hypothetical protein